MREMFKKIISENPVFVLLLGMCPTLAVTTTASNAIGMGLAATVVLIGSNVVISCLRKLIPQKIRIAAYIVIIAGFVSVIEMLLKAYLPQLAQSLGLFIPLIVVNCIILGRAEAFASKNGIGASFLDGLGMGLGFTFALLVLAVIREIFGNGTLFGFSLFPEGFQPAIMMILPPGGFITLGLVLAVIHIITIKKGGKIND